MIALKSLSTYVVCYGRNYMEGSCLEQLGNEIRVQNGVQRPLLTRHKFAYHSPRLMLQKYVCKHGHRPIWKQYLPPSTLTADVEEMEFMNKWQCSLSRVVYVFEIRR